MKHETIERHWDFIIVGAGMAGATLGHQLAKAGRSVLFCERGITDVREPAGSISTYPELQLLGRGSLKDASWKEIYGASGRSTDDVTDATEGRRRSFVPFLGSGSGGSSALYGMVLERFSPADFAPSARHSHWQESSLETSWPIGLAELADYYAAAEKLYRIRGGTDPLAPDWNRPVYGEPSRPLSPVAGELTDFLQAQGLHPYALPLACEFVDGCRSCQGVLCPKDCKNDSARVCLRPALLDHDATLLTDCRALRIEATNSRATGVTCLWRGQITSFRGGQIILAAGALQTPNLLLRSTSPKWVNGLANGSGLVGRNLMRHFIDLYAIKPVSASGDFENRVKEVAFNDFYCTDDTKLGSVQSFGRLPPAAMLFDSLLSDVRAGPVPWMAPALGWSRPLLQPAMTRLVDRSVTLATILEDLPYADNRVLPDAGAGPGAVSIQYRIHRHERDRIDRFRRVMRNVLKTRRWRLIKQAENNQQLAHACGTCRFGNDPATSVLDRYNRCHALDNLYVVDSSFFPSSGGTNPSLTIAANALRVSDHLLQK